MIKHVFKPLVETRTQVEDGFYDLYGPGGEIILPRPLGAPNQAWYT